MASWREEAAAQARADGEPPGLISHPPVPPGIRAYIWSEEKAATHSTAKPNEHGVFAEPVYFDCDRGGHTGYYVVPYERWRTTCRTAASAMESR